MEKDFKNVHQSQIAERNTDLAYARLLMLEQNYKITWFVEVLFKYSHKYLSYEFSEYRNAKELFIKLK